MSPTLYDRLDGEDGIEAVVDEFYERMLADERVAHFFADVDMQRQRAHQTQFLSAVAGGPVEYTGQEMAAAHDHLDIDRDEFEIVATHLAESLAVFDVDEADRTAVLTEVKRYEPAIVEADG